MRLPPKISASLSALILSACGGGGGGGGSGNLSQLIESQLIEFSSWANVQANQTVRLQGISHNTDYTAPAPNFVVTQLTASTDASSTVSITYDGQQNVSAVSLTSGSKSQTFATSSGDTIGNVGTYLAGYSDIAFAVDATGTNVGIAAEPLASNLNWNYQSFGAWETGRGTGSGYAAVASVGSMTTGAGIPTTGNATYTGYSGGVAISADGTQDFIVVSNFQATADFATRSVSIQATNSGSYDPVNVITNLNDTQYNYTGVLTYSAGSNSLSGTILTSVNNGTADGRFYGPSANEIGGIFEVRGAGVYGYFGAFGAKQ